MAGADDASNASSPLPLDGIAGSGCVNSLDAGCEEEESSSAEHVPLDGEVAHRGRDAVARRQEVPQDEDESDRCQEVDDPLHVDVLRCDVMGRCKNLPAVIQDRLLRRAIRYIVLIANVRSLVLLIKPVSSTRDYDDVFLKDAFASLAYRSFVLSLRF